jgi:hypothetical protein
MWYQSMTVSIALFAEKLLTQLPIASLIYAEDKRVVWASEALERWLHVESQQLTGIHLGELSIEKRKDEPGYFYIDGVAMPLSMHVIQLDQAGKVFACYFKKIASKSDGSNIAIDQRSNQVNSEGNIHSQSMRDEESSDSYQVHPYPIATANCHFDLTESIEKVASNPDFLQDIYPPNKRPNIEQFLNYEISRSRRYANPLSVIKLLLNIFPKNQKDLQQVSQSVFYFLSERTRWVDLIKNNQNGEFVLVFPETPAEMLPQIITKIHTGLHRLFANQYPQLTMHFEYGHACWQEGDNADMLLERASFSLDEQSSGSK